MQLHVRCDRGRRFARSSPFIIIALANELLACNTATHPAPSASAAPTTWHTDTTAPKDPGGWVAAACSAASNCWVEGDDRDLRGGLLGRSTAAHLRSGAWAAFNGNPTTWAVNGMTCPAVDNCWFVGGHNTSPTIALFGQWQGEIFKPQQSLPFPNGVMEGVACTSPTSCWAVGTVLDKTTAAIYERFDGSVWHFFTPTVTQDNEILRSVACPSADDCWAVGGWGAGQRNPGIQHWDGSAWSIVNVNHNLIGGLYAVACLTKVDCWAVGGSGRTPILMQFDGRTWSHGTAELGDITGVLKGIACTGDGTCWAVGHAPDATPLIVRFDGHRWFEVLGATPKLPSTLNAVACWDSNHCIAAGESAGQTFVERSWG